MKLLEVVVVAILLALQTEARGHSKFEKAVLDQHNIYRQKHGVPPLKLDNKLTDIAQKWANHLARTGEFKHNPKKGNLGENLYASFGPTKDTDSVNSWYNEVQLYTDYNNDPSITGHPAFKKIGHFTQVVWKGTKMVGVAKATSKKGWTYVVANYSPPGNYIGQYVANVLPPTSWSQEDK